MTVSDDRELEVKGDRGEVEANDRYDRTTCKIRPNGKGNSGITTINRRSTFKTRNELSATCQGTPEASESHPEGSSAGKEKDAEAGGHVRLYFCPRGKSAGRSCRGYKG